MSNLNITSISAFCRTNNFERISNISFRVFHHATQPLLVLFAPLPRASSSLYVCPIRKKKKALHPSSACVAKQQTYPSSEPISPSAFNQKYGSLSFSCIPLKLEAIASFNFWVRILFYFYLFLIGNILLLVTIFFFYKLWPNLCSLYPVPFFFLSLFTYRLPYLP